MLNHEQPPESLSPPASQVRVTPEELAAALARLEARRAGADGKIAIGDAVNELSLDATPEEVLAEVRAGQNQPQAVKPRSPVSLGQRLYFVAAILTVGITALWAGTTTVTPADMAASTPNPVISYDAPVEKPHSQQSPVQTFQHISVDSTLLVSDMSDKMLLLSEIGNNQPVHCGYNDITFTERYPGNSGLPFTLIKHGGKLYVRGWIIKMSPAVLAQDGADVSTTGDPNYAVPITLAVRGFTVSSLTPSWQSPDAAFHARNIKLDQHAYEKW